MGSLAALQTITNEGIIQSSIQLLEKLTPMGGDNCVMDSITLQNLRK
jgi:hypothetical protein